MKKKPLVLLLCLLFLASGCAASAPAAPKATSNHTPIEMGWLESCGNGRFPSLTQVGGAIFSYNAGEDTASGTCPLCGGALCPCADCNTPVCPRCREDACPYQDECPNWQDGACPYRDGRPARQGGGRGQGNGWRWRSRMGNQSPAI